MRILLIGGTALTGPHVIGGLLSHPGSRMFALSRHGQPVLCETPIRGDRRDTATLSRALAQARPDLVIDMVPFTIGDATGLVQALRGHGTDIPVILCSSCDVYAAYGRIHGTEAAGPQPVPITEDMALRQAYGPEGAANNKTGVERVALGEFPDVTILRLPAICAWPDSSRIAPYLDPMLDGQPRVTVPARRAQFRFSRALHKNVAHAIILAARAGLRGQHIYNVAEPDAHSEIAWATRIAACCGYRGDIVTGDGDVTIDQDLTISSDRIRHDLGYSEPHDPMRGLAEAVAFHSYTRRDIPYEKGY